MIKFQYLYKEQFGSLQFMDRYGGSASKAPEVV